MSSTTVSRKARGRASSKAAAETETKARYLGKPSPAAKPSGEAVFDFDPVSTEPADKADAFSDREPEDGFGFFDETAPQPSGIERYNRFCAALTPALLKSLKINPAERCRLYHMADVPFLASKLMPGMHWPLAMMRGQDDTHAATDILRHVHVHSIEETRTAGAALVGNIVQNGRSLIVYTSPNAAVPEWLEKLRPTPLDAPKDLGGVVMRAFRDALGEEGFFGESISTPPGVYAECFDDAIDERGRLRTKDGWVTLKLPVSLFGAMVAEIETQLKTERYSTVRLLKLVFGTKRVKRAEVRNDVNDAPKLAEMPGIRRVRKRVSRLISRMDKGQRKAILLVGPPGTGKTMMARTIAKETGRHIVATSFAAFQSAGDGHLGSFLSAMKQAFEEARTRAPSLLFIDEMDSFGSRYNDDKNGAYMRAVINGFLESMDGFKDRGDVVVLGATNDPDVIDPAILRHGRFGERLEMPNPDMEDVAEIAEWYISRAELPKGRSPLVTGQAVSLRCFTESSATVRAMVEEAVALAQDSDAELTLDHFSEAMSTSTLNGVERPEWTPDRLYRLAIHETGHAAAIHLLFGSRAKVLLGTAKPALGSAGHVVWEFEKGNGPDTVGDYAALIAVSLAGRAAEILHGGLGSAGFGAGSDLEKARKAAERLVEHGMLPARSDGFVDRRDADAVYEAACDWLTHLHRATMDMLAPHLDAMRAVAADMQALGDIEGPDLVRRMETAGMAAKGYTLVCD